METWNGTAKLGWFAGGDQVGEEHFSFKVECTELPESDLLPNNVRRDVTLKLVCDEARSRYGVPPHTVDIEIGVHRDYSPALLAASARWRMDSGDFCYGTGIMRVSPAPPVAKLVSLKTMEGGSMSTDTWRVTAFGTAGTEFTYEVEAESEQSALDEAYGRHGRRYRSGEVNEYLGTRSHAVRLGEEEVETE